MRFHRLAIGPLAVVLGLALRCPAQEPAANPLKSVKTFMCELEGLDSPGAVKTLAESNFDMLVVEPTFLLKARANFDAKAMVQVLHQGKPGRIVLAYLNIAEAEPDRVYWESTWHGPADGEKPFPAFLFAKDPDDPAGSYVCMFWRPRWRELLLKNNGLVDRIMAAGFDGLYLEGVDVCENDALSNFASRKENIDTEAVMVKLISDIRQHARQAKNHAVVVTQNTPELLEGQPKYAQAIDGICGESIWFSGRDGAAWEDTSGGDIPNREKDEDSTPGQIQQYQKFKQAGLPVFTIDYCVSAGNATRVYRQSAALGFVPLVTRISLAELTETPPPGTAK
jgi:cysteinyl-tRNA synthetase, unknown class